VDETGDLLLLGGADGTASVYSVSQEQVVQTLKCGSGAVVDGAWYGRQPVVSLSTGAVKIFDNGKESTDFSKHAGAAITLAMHPCGDILASVGADKSFILYDLQASKPITQHFTDAGK